jgi:hypothetical protein
MVDHPDVGMSPPIVFDELRAAVRVTDGIHWQIEDLLGFKMNESEAGARQRFPVLDQWLAASQERLSEVIPAIPDHQVDKELAERIHLRHAMPELETGPSPFSPT